MELYRLEQFEPGFNIDSAMVLEQHSYIFKNEIALHYHDFYEITLVEDGSSIHCINDKLIPIGRGQLTFIRPADCHCYMSYRSENYTMFNIRMSERDYFAIRDFLKGQTAALEEPLMPVSVRVSEQTLALLAAKMRALDEMPASPKRGAMVRTLLCEAFYELLNPDRDTAPLPDWFSLILERLTRDFATEIDISAVARECGVSREHMCRSFRKYLNVTPSQYINAIRLKEASRLLSQTERSVTEIAGDVGFNNPGYFFRLFGDYFKVSPREYRQRKLQAALDGDEYEKERIMLK